MNQAQKERRTYRQKLAKAITANAKRKGYKVIKPGIVKNLAFIRTQEAVKQFEKVCKSVEADAAKAADHDSSCVCSYCLTKNTPAS